MRALVVSDSARERAHLLEVLRPDPRAVLLAAVVDRWGALQQVSDAWVSIALVVHPCADDDAFALALSLKEDESAPRVAICTRDPSFAFVASALAAGLDGVIDLSEPAAQILESVAAVARGESVVEVATAALRRELPSWD